MTAIRNKRRKVAEYLIDQLAVDVDHRTDLIEFRLNTRIPIRERTITSRDLAYERGMMELVDLIDITSDEIRPSIKRYLQRRLKTRLDDIHQGFLKRMKERSRRLTTQRQEKDNEVQEDNEQEQEKEEEPTTNTPEDTNQTPTSPTAVTAPAPPPPPLPVMSQRTYKSHIEETIENLRSDNEKSIDETGKKAFRFSNYTLRYRLLETSKPPASAPPPPPINEPIQSKPTLFSLPVISPTIPTQALSRPTTTATLTSRSRHTHTEHNTQLPIRETRTSICRSARYITTPRVTSSVTYDGKSDAQSVISTSTNMSHRLLPKRRQPIRRTFTYIPQLQHAIYNEPRRSMPVTLRATAIGLPSGTRLIRD